MEELLIVVVIILVIVCAVIFGLLQKRSSFFKVAAPAVKEGGWVPIPNMLAKVQAITNPSRGLAGGTVGENNAYAAMRSISTNLLPVMRDLRNNATELFANWGAANPRLDDINGLIDIANKLRNRLANLPNGYDVSPDYNADRKTAFVTKYQGEILEFVNTIDAITMPLINIKPLNDALARIYADKILFDRDFKPAVTAFVANMKDTVAHLKNNDKANSLLARNNIAAIIPKITAADYDNLARELIAPPFDDISACDSFRSYGPGIVNKVRDIYNTSKWLAIEITEAASVKNEINALWPVIGRLDTIADDAVDFNRIKTDEIQLSADYSVGRKTAAVADAEATALDTDITALDAKIKNRIINYTTHMTSIGGLVTNIINVDDITDYIKDQEARAKQIIADIIPLSSTLKQDIVDYKLAGAATVHPYWNLLIVPLAACKHLPAVPPAPPPVGVDPAQYWFDTCNNIFEHLPSILTHVATGNIIAAYALAGEYFNYIDSVGPGPVTDYITNKLIPPTALPHSMQLYRVIINYVEVARASFVWNLAKGIYAQNNILQLTDGLAGVDARNLTAIDTNTTNFHRNADAKYTEADNEVYLHDVATKHSELKTIIANFKANGDDVALAAQTAKYAVFAAAIKPALDALIAPAVFVADPPSVEPIININIPGGVVEYRKIVTLVAFDHVVAQRDVSADYGTMERDITNYVNEITRVTQSRANEIIAQDTQYDSITAKISAMAKNIMSALKAEFVESSERMEAVKQDLEEQDRRDRARKKKEAEERQKLADDEYNARLDALAQIPDETLADRVARIPAEYSNVIHYAMAKRAAKLTKDTSYDVSAAEIGNTAVVRDKLVRFFTAQGVKDVTRDNINSKYAEWQKKNTARLVHQSDIDNPSGVVLELS